MEEGMKIRIGADVGQAINGINQVNKSLKTLSPASSQAGVSMSNLSRIVQDAPFGFIAISNNIDPLIQSFTQLKKETGSTGGALKALGASLLGGGGLAFAVSAVTAAITYFSMQSQKAERDTKKLGETIKSIADIRDESVGAVQGEIAQVKALTAAVLDENRAKSERLNAIEQLKGINKSYFGDLTLEANKLGTLTNKVNEYTQALIQQSIVKGFQDEISKIAPELSKQERELDKIIKKYGSLEQAAKAAALASAPSATNFTGSNFGGTSQLLDLKDGEKALIEQINRVSDLRTRYKELQEDINKAVGAQLKLKNLDGGDFKVKNAQFEFEDADIKAVRFSGKAVNVDPSTFIDLPGFSGITRVLDTITESGRKAGEALRYNLDTKQIYATADAVSNLLTPAFTGLFDSLIDGGRNALQSLGQFLTSIIKRLAAAAAQAAIFAAIISFASPGIPGGGGFGKIFGSQFKNILGFTAAPGNAAGRGAALNSIPVVLESRISGGDIVLSYNRTQSSINRRG